MKTLLSYVGVIVVLAAFANLIVKPFLCSLNKTNAALTIKK